MRLAIECWEKMEVPRSPFSRRPAHLPNCTMNGLSKPSATRISSTSSGVASSPAMRTAGSPGAICSIENVMTPTRRMTGMLASSRRTIYKPIRYVRVYLRIAGGFHVARIG